MRLISIIDTLFGDSGKGKISHLAAWLMLLMITLKRVNGKVVVVRFGGGDNAGHTMVDKRGEHTLSMLPCGILLDRVEVALGNGMVFNPKRLLAEMGADASDEKKPN